MRVARSIGGMLLALACGVAASAEPLPGQAPGTLDGRVVEAGTGTPIRAAEIRVSGPVVRSTLSRSDGRWRLDGLPPGEYQLRVHALGFGDRTARLSVPGTDASVLTVILTAVPLPLDALVVTAGRRLQRLADAPVATELITRREIERAGASDLSTVLVQRVGIQLEGGHPVGEGVMLQGMSSERVLVLIDGQPMVGRISGQIDLSRIPTSMVERVEVVKGPQSALYGSEAMGGVVNVVTRAATREPWRAGVAVTGGTQARADLSASLSGSAGRFGYVLDAGRRSTELTPGRAAEQGALAERWDGMMKLGWSADSTLRLEASAMLLDERQRWQGGQLFSFADNRQWNARLGAEWTRGAHRLVPALYWTEFHHLARQATSPHPVAGAGEDEVQRLLEAELLHNVVLGPTALDLGLEAKREEISSDRVQARDRALHTIEPFAQATWVLAGLQVVPGARVSWSEQWGTHFTPTLAAMLRPTPSLAVRGSVGRGYRAPGFKELYMEFLNLGAGTGYTVRGNPALQPETSTNLSLGAEWASSQVFLRGQLFHNRFDSFIETRLAGDSSGVTVYSYGNIADGFTRGAEIEGGMSRGALRVEAGYGWLQARQSATDEPLLGRPAHSGHVALEYAFGKGPRAALTGVYTGETPVRRTEAGTVDRDSFLRFDASIAQSLPQGIELSLGARNLFDARPEEWPGFAQRHLYLTLGWDMANSVRR
jgi:outer membrane receptor for ferrienterochelin and colicins